jgi:ligand-binding sensor domain-containing protein
LFTSCNEQNTSKVESNTLTSKIAIGDTVQKLGDSLWYVYQDKKNNYWFGSNGEGLYRYDGKTILNLTTKNGLSNDSIRQIKEDQFGNMYFATMSGIKVKNGN